MTTCARPGSPGRQYKGGHGPVSPLCAVGSDYGIILSSGPGEGSEDKLGEAWRLIDRSLL
jgi:hypothetical protein